MLHVLMYDYLYLSILPSHNPNIRGSVNVKFWLFESLNQNQKDVLINDRANGNILGLKNNTCS